MTQKMLALGKRVTDVTGSVAAVKASASAEDGATLAASAATLASSFSSNLFKHLHVNIKGAGFDTILSEPGFKEVTGNVVAGIQDDTSVFLWCDPDAITATRAAIPEPHENLGGIGWTHNSQPPNLESTTWNRTPRAPWDRVVYLTAQYGDYCIMQANSSMRRSKTWSLTFKGGGRDCGVNNHGAGAEMTGDLVKCNIGILHKQAPTVGPRMQYFWDSLLVMNGNRVTVK